MCNCPLQKLITRNIGCSWNWITAELRIVMPERGALDLKSFYFDTTEINLMQAYIRGKRCNISHKISQFHEIKACVLHILMLEQSQNTCVHDSTTNIHSCKTAAQSSPNLHPSASTCRTALNVELWIENASSIDEAICIIGVLRWLWRHQRGAPIPLRHSARTVYCTRTVYYSSAFFDAIQCVHPSGKCTIRCCACRYNRIAK